MPEISIDTFLAPGASARRSGNAFREEIVSGRATGLSADEAATKETAMATVIAKLTTEGMGIGTAHPSDASMKQVDQLFSGLSGDSIDFRLRYSTFSGGTLSSLVINIDSVLEGVQQPFFPGTRKPIVVGWTGRATDGGAAKPISPRITPDILRFNYLRPIIRLSGTKVFYGNVTPTEVVAAAAVLGCVNDDTFLGRPAGQWLMTSYATSQNKFNGNVAVRMEAMSKGIGPTGTEDWRALGVLYNDQIGKYAVPDPDKITAALTAPYVFDLIGGGTIYDPEADGFACLGPYPLTDFEEIWLSMGVDDGGEPPFPFVAPDPEGGIG